jgi:hypothetical protein
MADWNVYAKGQTTGPYQTMTQKDFEANVSLIRESEGKTFDIFLDAENILIWRWRRDNYSVIYIKAEATEMGEPHER